LLALELISKRGKSEYWPASRVIEFFSETDLNGKFSSDTWLLPVKINQGCYDVLQLVETEKKKKKKKTTMTLRVVQLTVAARHSLKMRYVITILDQLASLKIDVDALDVVVVVPNGQQDDFKIGNVESDKSKTIASLGWDINQLRVLGFRRVGL